MRRTIMAAAVVLGAGCSSSASSVPWDNYAPAVRERVDAAVDAGDCVALQTEFDAAAELDDVQRDRVGEGNGALMAYLVDELEAAGCG